MCVNEYLVYEITPNDKCAVEGCSNRVGEGMFNLIQISSIRHLTLCQPCTSSLFKEPEGIYNGTQEV